jgi:hypothetical protein
MEINQVWVRITQTPDSRAVFPLGKRDELLRDFREANLQFSQTNVVLLQLLHYRHDAMVLINRWKSDS